ncbi:Pre-rRNA-processing protein fhl1, partial [Serendipita sp. 399]
MESPTSVSSGLLPPPIISEIDTAGLSLLTQALMDSQPDTVDAIVPKPLPEPLPPEQSVIFIQENGLQEALSGTHPTSNIIVDLATHQPDAELLPPMPLKEAATLVSDEPIQTDDALQNGVNNETIAEEAAKPATEGGDIAAYFALEFLDMQYIYYLQRSSVSLGRSSNDASGPVADIDLGPLKNISRLHARIEYEEELERFVLA